MALFETILFVVQILVAIALCGLILLQHGKGADMGAAFGSGSSGSLFGAAGSANFLSRTTAILAAVFFLSSLGLTYLGTTHARKGVTQQGVMQDVPATKPADGNASGSAPATPAVPAPATTPSAPPSKAADIPK
ncbi:MAG TPA: preprotein translocase subunit SecG [Casimicrobiaceae bacterium]|nr:preprotein translocase subunit SecG [Casimicrobiaceae bacterium]